MVDPDNVKKNEDGSEQHPDVNGGRPYFPAQHSDKPAEPDSQVTRAEFDKLAKRVSDLEIPAA